MSYDSKCKVVRAESSKGDVISFPIGLLGSDHKKVAESENFIKRIWGTKKYAC